MERSDIQRRNLIAEIEGFNERSVESWITKRSMEKSEGKINAEEFIPENSRVE